MLTINEALACNYFHPNGCKVSFGPRGGIKLSIEEWRRNGRTRVWQRGPRAGQWRVPVKFGLYAYTEILSHDAHRWHTRENCPALLALEAREEGNEKC